MSACKVCGESLTDKEEKEVGVCFDCGEIVLSKPGITVTISGLHPRLPEPWHPCSPVFLPEPNTLEQREQAMAELAKPGYWDRQRRS